ncbi:glycosyltransferase [Spirosoma jeollabukense]
MSTFQNKNILFFQNSILPSNGGVPRVSDVITKELKRRGYNCFFIYNNKDNESYPSHIKLKIDINQPYSQIEKLIFSFIEEKNINVFICQNLYSQTFIKVYKSIRNKYSMYPFICFLHASPDYWQSSFKIDNTLSKYKYLKNKLKNTAKSIIYPFYNPYIVTTVSLYEIADKFVLLSESFKIPFAKIYSINNDDKLISLPNPLTFDTFPTLYDVINKEKIVLIVSRLVEDQKKISLALKLWNQLINDDNRDWKLCIVGSGPDEGEYKKYVNDNKLVNVTFIGETAHVDAYYQKASIFVMTSIWEGLPMALLEAQQNGVVPISFDNFSAIHDIISDGINGYIIHNNNLDQLSSKLNLLMNDDHLRNRLAINAIESSKRFHVSKIADNWELLINES